MSAVLGFNVFPVIMAFASFLTGRPKHKPKMTVEVLDMFLSAKLKLVLSETEHLHDNIVEYFGPLKVRNRDVDMIDSDNFWHVLVMSSTEQY